MVFVCGQLGDLACLNNAERCGVILLADEGWQGEDEAVQVGSKVFRVLADANVVGDEGFQGTARSFRIAFEVGVFEGVPEAFSMVCQDVVGGLVERVAGWVVGCLVLVVSVFEGCDGDVVGVNGGFDEVGYVVDGLNSHVVLVLESIFADAVEFSWREVFE